MIDHINKNKFTRWLKKLDKKLSKPDYMELITVYGGAWTGKTEFTHFVARANADNWVKVCYISLEMPREQLALRYALKRAWIKEYIEYQDKKYTSHQWELIEQYYKEFIDYKDIALVWEDRTYTIQDLLSENKEQVWIMTQYYDMGYRMFIIDNLGKIQSAKNEWEAQGEITSLLQSWKNKYKACIFLIHHTGKKQKGTEASMRWSQKIIDNATRVIKLERDSDTNATPIERARLEITQEKNSMRGSYDTTECYFDRGIYVEEFVGNLYKSKKVQEVFDDVSNDETF